MSNKSKFSAVRMAELSILTAIVIVLQLTGTAIRIPILGTSVSLVLVPIVLGAIMLGPKAGAWLGLVFGAVVYFAGGVMGMDFFTNFLFVHNPVITFCICIFKSTLAGLASGLAYKALEAKGKTMAVVVAAILAPVINTGIFVLGCLTILDTISAVMAAIGSTGTVIYFIFIGCAGWNFIFELTLNLLLAGTIERIIRIVRKTA